MANLSIRNLAAAIRARIDPSYRIDLYIPERGPINLKNCLLNAPRGEGIGLDRITVYDVLSMLSKGMSYQQVLQNFPELTKEDIFAVLAYASDREHRV